MIALLRTVPTAERTVSDGNSLTGELKFDGRLEEADALPARPDRRRGVRLERLC
jgi:hypothetical protein